MKVIEYNFFELLVDLLLLSKDDITFPLNSCRLQFGIL
jgi:hypothetical protein